MQRTKGTNALKLTSLFLKNAEGRARKTKADPDQKIQGTLTNTEKITYMTFFVEQPSHIHFSFGQARINMNRYG